MSIQLADRSTKYPRGIIDDVLVQVGSLVFQVDFVIIDISGDIEVPLILGRPFLATTKALIDVGEGKLTLRLGEEEVILRFPDAMRRSRDQDDTFL